LLIDPANGVQDPVAQTTVIAIGIYRFPK